MRCALCDYMMSSFDTECPRCHGKGLPSELSQYTQDQYPVGQHPQGQPHQTTSQTIQPQMLSPQGPSPQGTPPQPGGMPFGAPQPGGAPNVLSPGSGAQLGAPYQQTSYGQQTYGQSAPGHQVGQPPYGQPGRQTPPGAPNPYQGGPPMYPGHPGYPPLGMQATPRSNNKIAAGICGIFFGALGIHKFILGYGSEGATMLLLSLILGPFLCFIPTFIISFIGFIEGILYLTKNDQDFMQTYVYNRRGWF